MSSSSGNRTGANIEIRPAAADEMRDLNRLTAYAFANNEVPKEDPDPDLHRRSSF